MGPPAPAVPTQTPRSISLSPDPAPLSEPSIWGPTLAPTQRARGPLEIWIWLVGINPLPLRHPFPFPVLFDLNRGQNMRSRESWRPSESPAELPHQELSLAWGPEKREA